MTSLHLDYVLCRMLLDPGDRIQSGHDHARILTGRTSEWDAGPAFLSPVQAAGWQWKHSREPRCRPEM